jgi:Peptidase_C39 like family
MAGINFKPQIDFEMETQRGDHLCWIAVAVSVKRHFDRESDLQQWELVRKLKRTGDCGTAAVLAGGDVPERCDKPGRLEAALDEVSHLAAESATHPNPSKAPMTFQAIQTEIDAGRPVCAYIEWSPGSEGHFILISGYHETNGDRYLYVKDPLYRDGVHSYEHVVKNYLLDGTWEFTYRLKKG